MHAHAVMEAEGIAEVAALHRTIAAEELFRLYADFVARFLARLGVSDVDDLVQEVFLVVHRRGGYAERGARPTTWLAEIAVRVASTARRTARRRPLVLDEIATETATDAAASPFDRAVHAQSLDRVQQALDTLTLDARALFILFELEGESCDAIATALKVPVGTVYSRLHAARRAFREAYERLTTSPSAKEQP